MPWYLPDRAPVFWEEARRRLRGRRGLTLLIAYVLLLIVGLLVFNYLMQDSVHNGQQQWPEVGRRWWQIFIIGQGILLTFISPALTASTISAERERHTLEQLFLTRLTTMELTWGKYLGAIVQLLVMLLAGLPIAYFILLQGGVSLIEVVVGYLLLMATALYYAALGYFASCFCKRVGAAIAWAYGLVVFVNIGVPILNYFPFYFFNMEDSIVLFMIALDPTYLFLCMFNSSDSAIAPLLWKVVSLLVATGVLLQISGGLIWNLREKMTARPMRPLPK